MVDIDPIFHPENGPPAAKPKKGDLIMMTNFKGISFVSVTAKVYNKILLNRFRYHVDSILRSNRAGLCSGRSCTQKIHVIRRIMEGFQDYQLPLTVTFIDYKNAFDSINRKVMFAVLRHYGYLNLWRMPYM